MIIRCGLPKHTGTFPKEAAAAGYHGLVSAGAMWDIHGKRFREPGAALWLLPSVALDSAGFVAMVRYKGYPWSVKQYVDFVANHRKGKPWPWAWWSSMDLCCEPQVASDTAEVRARVEGTARLLRECNEAAALRHIPAPMPILQGWRPDDYAWSAELTGAALGQWPALVGVGSVCRRQPSGPAGLWAVLERLDRELPAGVQLHFFGVKGTVLGDLAKNPRVASVDSGAWDLAARGDLWKRRLASGHDMATANVQIRSRVVDRVAHMHSWMERMGGLKK